MLEFVPDDRSVQLFSISFNLTTSTDLLEFVWCVSMSQIFNGSKAEVCSEQHLFVDSCEVFFLWLESGSGLCDS